MIFAKIEKAIWHLTLRICVAALLLSSCQSGSASASVRIAHPDDATKTVEYFLARPQGSDAPWPTVVLLHGHQQGARQGGKDFVDWGVLEQLAGRGYLAVAVSQPGYGASSGPADYSGVFTQHAVAGVIARLHDEGLVARNRLLIQGISRGALTAGLVAAEDPSVAGLVLISGVFDVQAYVADSNATGARKLIVRSMISETGGSDAALLARSILHRAGDIKASVLILNGAKDDRTDPNQARTLAEHITRAGGNARAVVYENFGHQIPLEARNNDIDPFIEKVLGAARIQRPIR